MFKFGRLRESTIFILQHIISIRNIFLWGITVFFLCWKPILFVWVRNIVYSCVSNNFSLKWLATLVIIYI